MKTPPPAAPAAGPPTWPPSAPPSSRPSKTPATCTSPKAGATTPPQPKPSTFTASIKTETDIHGTRRSPDLRGRVRGGDPGPGELPERLPAAGVGHQGGDRRAGGAEAAAGDLVPAVDAGAGPA